MTATTAITRITTMAAAVIAAAASVIKLNCSENGIIRLEPF